MAITEALMTIEEFAALPDTGTSTELVRGRIIEVPPTNFFHGIVCGKIAFFLQLAVERQGSGRVVTNDSGVVTQRDPDSVRGPDVAYYSAARIPPVGRWTGYPEFAPDLVVEVRSPSDRWGELLAKAAEFLRAGVLVVVLLDPETRSACVVEADRAPRNLGPEDTLTFPDLLGDFAVVVGRIFD